MSNLDAPAETLDKPIAAVIKDERTLMLLHRLGINTLGQLATCTADRPQLLLHLGPSRRQRIETALHANNLGPHAHLPES